ncbi:type IV pilus biogenesis protein PilM [Bacillus canaveralius]|nr:pilus assembly protein PilM [Bacillus canaveralius]RSK52441.1 pilus assembly protein PilM [Bacillus canaveralius]
MALNFHFGKARTVNLTIKDHIIRFVELKQANPPVPARTGARFLPPGIVKDGKIIDPETLETIMEECVANWKISRKQVRFLVPDPFVVIRKTSIPPDIKDDEIRGYLYMELGTSIHLPFEEAVFDFYPLSGKDSEKKELLLFAAPEEIVKEYVDLLERARLKPNAADISCLALYRLYHQFDFIANNDILMMIQFDLQTVNVSIFENHLPVFMRHIGMDTDASAWNYKTEQFELTGSRSEVLNPLEDIYKEIDRVMNFYHYSLNQGSRQVTKIIVDGDHPWLDEIFAELNKRFSVRAEKITNRAITGSPDKLLTPFHVNLGLGLKEV